MLCNYFGVYGWLYLPGHQLDQIITWLVRYLLCFDLNDCGVIYTLALRKLYRLHVVLNSNFAIVSNFLYFVWFFSQHIIGLPMWMFGHDCILINTWPNHVHYLVWTQTMHQSFDSSHTNTDTVIMTALSSSAAHKPLHSAVTINLMIYIGSCSMLPSHNGILIFSVPLILE